MVCSTNLSQAELEKEIGVSHGTLSRLLHANNKKIRIFTMEKVSNYFKVPIDEIADFKESYDYCLENNRKKEELYKKELKKVGRKPLKDKVESSKEHIPKQCLNQKCPLNENKLCGSPVVLAGVAGCASENLITEPTKEKTAKEKKQIKIIKYNVKGKNYEKCV